MSYTEKISMHALVTVTPTSTGWRQINKFISAEGKQRNVDADPINPHSKAAQTDLTMPMWELMKIFGPGVITSGSLPFHDISFARPRSSQEERYFDVASSADRLENSLRTLADILGINHVGSRGSLLDRSSAYAIATPPLYPDEPGQWWLGDKVVTVVDNSTEYRGDATPCLAMILGNGRRKPVEELDDWGGRALRDLRLNVKSVEIPF